MTKNKDFSWEKVPMSKLQADILLTLHQEQYPLTQKALAKSTKSSIGGVSKALDGLSRYGLIAYIKQELGAYFINPFRKEEIERFLTGLELGKSKDIVLSGHAFTYEADLNDLPEKLMAQLEKDKSFISYSPNGWKALKQCLIDGSYKFHKTPNGCKLIAYFHTFGFNSSIIEQINTEKFLSLKKELEDAYPGLKVGNNQCVASCPWQEYALLKDPIAQAGIYLGIKHKKIENSYKFDVAEWEEKGYNAKDKIQKIIDLRDKETEILEDVPNNV